MDDRLSQFLLLVGNACDDARVGALRVEVILTGSEHVSGVPHPRPASGSGEEVDETGWSRDLRLDGTRVGLADVRELRIVRPPG